MAIQMLRKVITLFPFIVIDFKIITAEFRAHGGERPSRKYFIELHTYRNLGSKGQAQGGAWQQQW